MEFEYWWLLAIPLAFGLGWVASRREGRLDERPATMGNAYFRGVNLLLNEQSDKAIDAFVDVVRIEPEASASTRACIDSEKHIIMVPHVTSMPSSQPAWWASGSSVSSPAWLWRTLRCTSGSLQ